MPASLVAKAALAAFLLLIANAQWAFIFSNFERLEAVERARSEVRKDVQDEFVRSLSDSKSGTGEAGAPAVAELPSSVALPFISVTAPVAAAGTDPDAQLDSGTVAFWTSPGKDGKRAPVVVGHSSAKNVSPYMYVFTQIPKMGRGKIVALGYTGTTVTYEFVRGKIVSPEAVDELEGGEGRAYLVTCYPFLTSLRRYVVELRAVGEYRGRGREGE